MKSQSLPNIKLIKILIITGLVIATLSAFETKIEWLASLCGFLGDGCRDAEQFSLFKIPVPYWGIGYFLLLAFLIFRARPSLFWFVMAGVGAELTFVSIMFNLKIVCFLCILNFVVILGLFFLTIDKNRIWQALSVCLLVFIASYFLLSRQNLPGTHNRDNHMSSSVVAKVGNLEITTTDIETPLAGRIYKLEKKIYDHKKDKLKDLIEMALLEMEAKQKGIPVQNLVNKILSEGTDVSDLEIENYYSKNREKMTHWKDSEEKLMKKIKDYLRNKKTTQKIEAYTNPLKQKYGVTVSLKPPALPFAEVNVDKNHFTGPSDAAVTIVEFSDYKCPSCRRAHKMTKDIKKQYQGKIKWVFKDYPLNRHKGAKEMAAAARCAGEQGKFWEYQDIMFTFEGTVTNTKLKEAARKIGLDMARFTRSLESKKHISAVEQDIKDAKDVGVSSTPTFIIDGRLSPGNLSPEKFKQMIDDALTKKQL